jgi:Uma2 family endonuclease
MRLLLDKVANYLAAGTVVWLVDPDAQTLSAYAPASPARTYGIGDTFTGEGVLAGFTLALDEIFDVEGD